METTEFCIEALRGAMLLSKQAIQVEIAVCFIVFCEHGGDTGPTATKVLRGIYAEAGRADCLTPDSPSYKTVQRRMRRCGDFYDTIGHKRIKRMLNDKHGDEAITVIRQFIEPYEISSMDDVAAHAGKPRQASEERPPKKSTADKARRATDAPGTVHIKTKHMDIPVPPDVTKAELLQVAKKITAIAEKMA